MIEITPIINDNVYKLEITTKSHEEWVSAWELLLQLRGAQEWKEREQQYG